ncbi:MAG: F0F1 ATP synthase subunit A [Bacteroidaceae bacterium]|nr:F0F1 ATP synthase subunit A [Bacteroidaceae bacterium]MBQ8270548.1 F0F1 ATP synthase subunit A [Bacteroidaceae bacterium]
MDKVRWIFVLLLLFAALPVSAADAGKSSDVDVKGVIFGHVKDAYEWHVTTLGDKHISVSLPILLYSRNSGWNIFSSSVFHHSKEYNGFHIAESGVNEGKVVEYDKDGNEVRPFIDLSITKNVLAVFFNSALLLVIVLFTARWYKRNKNSLSAPRGFVGVMEMLITMIVDEVIKPAVGKRYHRYVPYLLTAFFFIFLSNLMGLIPIFPGGANVTGNIAVTLALALCTFVAVNFFGNKEYWREIFWPDVPTWLKVPIPLMPFIEIFGIFVKPFALTIRLFANILAGHTALLAFVCIIFITMSVSRAIGTAMTAVSVMFTIFMNVLELLVAFIQAFVFTMLSAVFIGLSQPEHHADNTHDDK